MQMTSLTYDPYVDERSTTLKVSYELIDTDAADTATPTVSGECEISKLAQSHNKVLGMTKKLATLETDYCELDGTFIFPDQVDNGEVGWWSDAISGADGTFASNPYLEFSFLANQTSAGFTIVFDDMANEYCSEFTIQAFNSLNALIGNLAVTGNTKSVYIANLPVENYRRIRITFTKTANPYRRVRICEFVFGFFQIFTKDDIKSLSLIYETVLSTDTLPTNQMIMTIDNTDRRYNILNPAGIYKYLQQGQGLSVQIGVGPDNNIEAVNMGRFYFAKATAEDNSMTAQITAYDMLYFLTDTKCRIGSTGSWTVAAAVAAVIADSGLNIATVIDSVVGTRVIGKAIPQEASHREALRLIAQAGRCSCYFNREDKLIFDEIAVQTPVDTLDNDNMYSPVKVSDIGRINTVEITVRDEYANTTTVYSANNVAADEIILAKNINNPLANQETANWLLSVYGNRSKYEAAERGNPAREFGDTVMIYDAYGENRNAVVIKEQYDFNGKLGASTVAQGGI